ncbi:hypothetical protein SLS64_012453 [Diaporthe eres]|uniref:Uncharacterized protein n=1 Tax=Diaporthe eres TaxID=83184 RepID=A0ABR1NYJ5_DIAER
MDTTPVKRSANCNQDFANPHFKPLWEPDTTVGRNAIKYSLVHHVYQQRISNARLCGFCTDELTRRVSEAARRLKTRGLFHDDRAFMDLFWQQEDRDGGALVAGETIVAVDNKNGDKIAVVDHLAELSLEPARAGSSWWRERGVGFQGELGAMDRTEVSPSRAASWFGGCDGGGPRDPTPWQTRFLGVLWRYSLIDTTSEVGMRAFVDWQERCLNYTHENCRCVDILRLRSGVSFDTVLMERVLTRIDTKIWEIIPFPPEYIWRNKGRFLTYSEDQLTGVQNRESVWDYAFSRGEVVAGDKVVPRPLPLGWQRRWVSNNTEWYHDCRGRLVSRDEHYQCLPDPSPAARMTVIGEEEDLIEL